MAFKERLKEARARSGMTQEQVASKTGIAKSTLAGYEIGSSEPNMFIMSKIIDVLGIDANFLLQDQINHNMALSLSELDYLKKYRQLDDFGKETIQYAIKRELQRTELIASQKERIAELEATRGIREQSYKYGELAAAHERTDTKVTEESRLEDDAIMHNDSEWE